MGPKRTTVRSAWSWASNTEPEQITQHEKKIAYRVHLKCCKIKTCKKNCKLNSRCLIGLGEQDWLDEVPDEKWNFTADPETERRSDNLFVGLRNLGATCYVNSLLQLWFNNLSLRKAIYKWDSYDDANGNDEAEVYTPSSSVAHLQLIFAFLQLSKRRCIDPSEFVKSLRLNTEEEQDAQEFSKLFLNLLEDQLQSQANPEVRDIIQQQFKGEYSYVTTCLKCKRSSSNPSKFYELQLTITDHNEINECIDEFLKEEKLNGDDKYFCSRCQRKRNATRRIKLSSMPLVLNLQLLRFIYDRNKGQKRKLNSYISFPEVLDMSDYMDPPSKCIYDLTAVLIHCGRNTNAGHYIANIKDKLSNAWYRFNDENIEKIVNLELSDDDAEKMGPKRVKKPKPDKGHHLSQNAYMLVYTKRSAQVNGVLDDEPIESLIPSRVKNCIEKDNAVFEEWVAKIARERDERVVSGKERQNEIRQFYTLFPTKPESSFEWIPLTWLTQWMNSNCVEVKPVDNSKFLCSHSKLNPDSGLHLKCVSVEAANLIYNKYGGGPRLTDSSICEDCVVSKCRTIRLRTRLDSDDKFITSKIKYIYTTDNPDTFWVGRVSLRLWRKYFIDKKSANTDHNDIPALEESNEEKKSEETDENPPAENVSGASFNDEIICPHGKLNASLNTRKLVSKDVWLRLQHYFPNAPEFTNASATCETCQDSRNEVINVKQGNRATASEQKEALIDLYRNRNRPIKTVQACGDVLYAVNSKFVDEWRKYIKSPSSRSPPVSVDNDQLICPHDGIKVLPTIDDDIRDDNYNAVLVWAHEWESIRRFYIVDRDVVVICECGSQSSSHPSLVCTPNVCSYCNGKDQSDVFDFINAPIFVRKLNLEEDEPDQWEEISEGPPSKKKRVDSTSDDQSQLESSTNVIRRSSRRRRVRGEVELKMSSAQTLRDLKLEIEKKFSVVPDCQRLSLDGRELKGEDKTLNSLKFSPSCCVLLTIDEEEVTEEGFKGTELVNR